MSSLISDVIEGTLTPGVGNVVCNAGGKLLKNAELEVKYGTVNPDKSRTLTFIHSLPTL
jgi:hypothetical protein